MRSASPKLGDCARSAAARAVRARRRASRHSAESMLHRAGRARDPCRARARRRVPRANPFPARGHAPSLGGPPSSGCSRRGAWRRDDVNDLAWHSSINRREEPLRWRASTTTIQRTVLPIPDKAYAGLVTYDAKDPATSFPPIEPLRPPEGAPNVLIVLIDDVGFSASSAFGGPCSTPTAERLAANGLKYNRFHTTALCSPTRQALLTGRNHHSVGMGGITEIATSAPGYNSIRPNTCAPLAETAEAERLRDRAVRQVPRGAGLGDEPDGAVRRVADGLGLRALLRLHRRRDEPVRARDLPRHGADRAAEDGRGGLPLHRGHDRPGDRLGQAAEGADAGQALLRLLRAGRDARAAPRADGVVGQVQGRRSTTAGTRSASERSRSRRSSA